MKKSIAYYPGCSVEGLAEEFDRSTRAICRALDVDLVEIPDWSCCGSTPSHAYDPILGAALAGRNLAIAEAEGVDTVMTPCPSCLKSLKGALEVFREKTEAFLDILQMPFTGNTRVISVLQLLYEDIGVKIIQAKVRRSLAGTVIAPYYGCLLTRPAEFARFDDPENPISLDELLHAMGASVPDFAFKTECCGAAFGVTENRIVGKLTGRILEMASRLNADAIAVACPLCQQNLDLRQSQVERVWRRTFNMPVIYITQLIGYALGIDPKKLGFEKLFVNPDTLFQKLARAKEKRHVSKAP
jgi:heterodisulfide reductase subunit B2